MAKPKRKQSLTQFMREESERLHKERPIVKTRWFVIEIRPAYNTGGYYDEDVPEKKWMVSKYFDTREQAIEWLNDHDPDEGNQLKVAKENLREWTVREWVSW